MKLFSLVLILLIASTAVQAACPKLKELSPEQIAKISGKAGQMVQDAQGVFQNQGEEILLGFTNSMSLDEANALLLPLIQQHKVGGLKLLNGTLAVTHATVCTFADLAALKEISSIELNATIRASGN